MAHHALDTATKRLGLTRFAGVCGLLAFVTFNAGWVAADLAQPQAFSPARDDLSDLGALTASTLALQPACCQPLRLVGNRARNRCLASTPSEPSRSCRRGGRDRGRRRNVPRWDLPPRLPGNRCRLHQRLLALTRAQDRIGVDCWRHLRRVPGPGTR